ncbi:Homocysteine S-methyltransferase-like protein [Gracilaria domingensis]|nr:Homocysteine S-methyltransferase-like protein [Gracilaria domingensis]
MLEAVGLPRHAMKGRVQPLTSKWYEWLDSFPGPVILDGGLGFILEDRGNDLDEGGLWSVAKEWLDCGADIISTATYQVNTKMLEEEFSLSSKEAKEAMHSAWNVLDNARREFWEQLTEDQQQSRRYPVIAVSCGPYSAILPNISEYSGKYDGVTEDDIRQFHLERLQSLQELIPWTVSDLDQKTILCFETIGNTIEAELIAQLMGTDELRHIPYWISFQCKDALHISCGDLLSKAVEAAIVHHAKPNLVAIGVNCVDAFEIQSLQGVLRSTISSHVAEFGDSHRRVDTVCYPNSGEVWSLGGWYWRNEMRLNYSEWAKLTCGTQSKIVGGCCRVGPDYIRALQRERVRLSGRP